jgi:hypothetical protein
LGAQGFETFLAKLWGGIPGDQFHGIAGDQARQKEVDGNRQEEGKKEFDGAAGEAGH